MTAGAAAVSPAPLISFVTTCKGRLEHLRQSLPQLARQPHAQVIVVDYDCPDGAGDWAAFAHPEVTVVRVENAPLFNVSRARNAGAQAAVGEWICFVDADIVLAGDFVERAWQILNRDAYYRVQSERRDAFGTMICGRADYVALEGYDEVMEGWGYEDVDFYFRLGVIGRVQHALPADWMRALDHGNAERVRFYADRMSWRSLLTNAFYAQVKHDLIRHLGNANLPLDLRADIYRRVAAALGGAERPEACRAELTVTLPPGLAEQFNPKWHIRRTVHYVLEPRDQAETQP